MSRTFYSSKKMTVTSEIENASSRSEGNARKSFMDLANSMDDVEILLSASKCYLDASTERLEMMRSYLCIAEVDTRSAGESIIELEKKLKTMRLELQSLYRNIFCSNSDYDGSLYDENERGANNIQVSGVTPEHVFGAISRYPAETSPDVFNSAEKLEEYEGSLFAILHPKNTQHENPEEDITRDWTYRESNTLENSSDSQHSTFNTDNRNPVCFRDSESINQRYEEERSLEVPYLQNPDYFIDPPMRKSGYYLNRKQTRKFPRLPFQSTIGNIQANATTNATLCSGRKFDDRHSNIGKFSEKTAISEENSWLRILFGYYTTRASSNLNDRTQNFSRLPEVYASKKIKPNRKSSRQLNEFQREKISMKPPSKAALGSEVEVTASSPKDAINTRIYKTRIPQTEEVILETQSPRNPFLVRRQQESWDKVQLLTGKCNQTASNITEGDESFSNRNIIKPNKKASISSLSLRSCGAEQRKDLNSKSEGMSQQCLEISLPTDWAPTRKKISKRITDERVDNFFNTFETDTKLKKVSKDMSKSESVSSYTPKLLWQDKQSANRLQTKVKDSRSSSFQIDATKTKLYRKSPIALTDDSSRKCFRDGNGRNSYTENISDNVLTNMFSSRVYAESDKESNGNKMDSKYSKISPFDLVSESMFQNTMSLDSDMQFPSSTNRSVPHRGACTSNNNAFISALGEEKPYSHKQKDIPQNPPIKFREIADKKNLGIWNSVENLASSGKNSSQSRNMNSRRVSQKQSDLTWSGVVKETNVDNRSAKPIETLINFGPDDGKDLIPFADEFPNYAPDDYMTANISINSESEYSEISNLSFREFDSVYKQENNVRMNYGMPSFEAIESDISHKSLWCLSLNSLANTNYYPLSSTGKQPTHEITGTATAFGSSDRIRLLEKHSSSSDSSCINRIRSSESDFEDLPDYFDF